MPSQFPLLCLGEVRRCDWGSAGGSNLYQSGSAAAESHPESVPDTGRYKAKVTACSQRGSFNL